MNEVVGPVGFAFSCSSFAIAFFSSVFLLENLYDPLAAFVCCTNINSSDSVLTGKIADTCSDTSLTGG